MKSLSIILSDKKEQIIKTGNLIAERLDNLELIIALITFFSVILKIETSLPVDILATIALISLAVLYFFSGFSVPDDQNAGGAEMFVNKILAWGKCITAIGILFRLRQWPGDDAMLILGCSILIITLLAMIILRLKKRGRKMFNQQVIIRLIILAALGLVLNFIPGRIMVKLGLHKDVPVEVTR